MTVKVDQPSAMPTRKLSAATITAALMAVTGMLVRNLWPEWYDENVWLALMPLVSLAVGYFVKDEANAGPLA